MQVQTSMLDFEGYAASRRMTRRSLAKAFEAAEDPKAPGTPLVSPNGRRY
jgi:hypothetical protein